MLELAVGAEETPTLVASYGLASTPVVAAAPTWGAPDPFKLLRALERVGCVRIVGGVGSWIEPESGLFGMPNGGKALLKVLQGRGCQYNAGHYMHHLARTHFGP